MRAAFLPLVLAVTVLATLDRTAAYGQDPPVVIPDVEPRAEDVSTLDGIITAFYEVISGPAGAPRDWGRDATLYLPGIAFTTSEEPGSGPTTTPKDEWVRGADPFLTQAGFVEREIHRVTRRFGRIANVWSTYEWETADGRTGRGINSIQLFHDGERWYITHATWDSERPDNPIPPEFLPTGPRRVIP